MSIEAPSAQFHVPLGCEDELSTQVSTAMVSVLDTTPTALPPLYDAIDPEALETIFSPHRSDSWGIHDCPTTLAFEWCERGVWIKYAGNAATASHERTLTITTDAPSPSAIDPELPTDETVACNKDVPIDVVGTSVFLSIADVVDDDLPDICDRLTNRLTPDALTALFQPQQDGTARATGSLSFVFEGYSVTVTSAGRISIAADDGQLALHSESTPSDNTVPALVDDAAWSLTEDRPKPSR